MVEEPRLPKNTPPAPPESAGDFQLVYRQLRGLAARMLDGERTAHTLQATALVHEAWLSLLQSGSATASDPIRFLRLAAMAMRHVLIDHARTRGRHKRGGGAARISLDALELASQGNDEQILAVDDAITRLEQSHPDLAELVRLRFFAGLSVEDSAKALGTSVRTVHRDWTAARALLASLLAAEPG